MRNPATMRSGWLALLTVAQSLDLQITNALLLLRDSRMIVEWMIPLMDCCVWTGGLLPANVARAKADTTACLHTCRCTSDRLGPHYEDTMIHQCAVCRTSPAKVAKNVVVSHSQWRLTRSPATPQRAAAKLS